jgi:clan AA aspartic protease (TIGR02281 family)
MKTPAQHHPHPRTLAPLVRSARRTTLWIACLLSSACFSVPPGSGAGGRPVAGSLWVRGAERPVPSAERTWVPSTTARQARLDGDGSQLLVEVRLNGRVSGTFLLDTGASYCVITPETARRLGIAEQAHAEAITLVTPTGEIEAPLMMLRSVEVANSRARDIQAVIYPAVDAPLSGILGLSFLSQFEFSIDTRRRILRLRPF